MTRIYAVAAAAIVVAFLGGIGIAIAMGGNTEDDFAQCRGSSIAGAGDVGGPFELVSETGETVTDETLITEPTLVYFGYTFCPDVCPFDAVRNADAAALLVDRGMSALPIFISVDPQRDTPEQLSIFTDNIYERMIGLTGSREQIDDAVSAYRAYYNINDTGDEYYLIDHTAFTYLVLPEHGFVDFFRREATAEQIADRTACFIEATS
ncbi:MAG: SCO family protein [Pseudomonadota bacterium]